MPAASRSAWGTVRCGWSAPALAALAGTRPVPRAVARGPQAIDLRVARATGESAMHRGWRRSAFAVVFAAVTAGGCGRTPPGPNANPWCLFAPGSWVVMRTTATLALHDGEP